MTSIPNSEQRQDNIDWLGMLKRATEIATRAHEGQTRWGGEPYITHPLAVAEAFAFASVERIAAVMHDVIEDSDITADQIRSEFPDNPTWQIVVNTLESLTHRDGESYADYIMRIRKDGIARLVKMGDLLHNLSDLDGRKHRQRRDKYELALRLLELP